jgi:DNA-damage-inducible protein D
MKSDVIKTLTETFEAHAQQAETCVEYWLARDIQYFGYTKWDNFLNVVSKAKTACEVSNYKALHHFADVGKMVNLGSRSQREINDIMLMRYACCPIASSRNSRKEAE